MQTPSRRSSEGMGLQSSVRDAHLNVVGAAVALQAARGVAAAGGGGGGTAAAAGTAAADDDARADRAVHSRAGL